MTGYSHIVNCKNCGCSFEMGHGIRCPDCDFLNIGLRDKLMESERNENRKQNPL